MDPRVAELHHRAARCAGLITLAGGLPAEELLPRTALAAVLGDAAKSPEALQYSWPEGNEIVRAWIARRLHQRGLAVDADAVLVTTGAQQALALVAAELGCETIAVGDATYPAALDAFRAAGLAPVAAPDGAGAHYVIPGAANPHGRDLVEPRRAELLASNAHVIADEAYVELRFDGRVPRPLAIDAPDRVWHIGTISKTLCPGLRLGWVVPPARYRTALLARKQAADLQTAGLSQLAFARVLDVIDYDAIVLRARRTYYRRAECLFGALRRYIPQLRVREPEGGFSLWCETDRAGDDVALLEAALERGVSLDPGHVFRPDGATGPLAFRVCFSSASHTQLEEGVRRLARVL